MLSTEAKPHNSINISRIICILILFSAVFFYWHSSEAGSGGFTQTPTIHFFSEDTAPADGEIAIFINYGEENRPEGWMMANWNVLEGQHMDKMVELNAMRYARAWFRPDGSDDWYLLPSQYWHGGGSCRDEFGVSPRNEHPSYHTHFDNMIHQDEVPHLTRLDECPFGSSHYCPQSTTTSAPSSGGDSEPVPTATPLPTPVPPTPTPDSCIVLRNGVHAPCNKQ